MHVELAIMEVYFTSHLSHDVYKDTYQALETLHSIPVMKTYIFNIHKDTALTYYLAEAACTHQFGGINHHQQQ